jgi:cytochrome c-type biogenesis protein CcmH
MTRSVLSFVLGLVVALAAGSALAQARGEDPRLEALEEHFIAPCCWTEPLSTHDSPLARQLRDELRARLAAGESPSAIEASLVERYGARILSTPPGIEPVAVTLLAAILLAGLVLYARSRRSVDATAAPASDAPASDRSLDEALARELAALDE